MNAGCHPERVFLRTTVSCLLPIASPSTYYAATRKNKLFRTVSVQ